MARGVVRVLTVAVPIAVGAVRAAAAAVRALRRAADRRRLRLVPRARWPTPDDPALYSIGRVAGWIVRAAADLPAAGVPDRPAREPRRPGARRGPRSLLVVVLYLPTALLVERVPGAGAVDELRRELSRRTRSWSRIGAGVHRGPRAPAAGVPDDRAVRGRRRAARAAHPRLDPAHAPRARACAGRGVLPLRGLRGDPPRAPDRARRPASSSVGVGCSRSTVPLTALAFLVGPRALVGVHRARDAAARGAAARASAARRTCGRALAEAFDDPSLDDRVLARQRRRALGRRGRAPASIRPRPRPVAR